LFNVNGTVFTKSPETYAKTYVFSLRNIAFGAIIGENIYDVR